jgi:Transcriptional regulators
LRRAPHVHVAGFRSCYAVAFGLVYGYRLFRPSVSLLNGEAGTLEMQLRTVERDSATIVISFAPYSVEAARVAEAALEKGSKLIAITDSAVSPIALECRQGADLFARKPVVLSIAGGGHGDPNRWSRICSRWKGRAPSSNSALRSNRCMTRARTSLDVRRLNPREPGGGAAPLRLLHGCTV